MTTLRSSHSTSLGHQLGSGGVLPSDALPFGVESANKTAETLFSVDVHGHPDIAPAGFRLEYRPDDVWLPLLTAASLMPEEWAAGGGVLSFDLPNP